MPFFDPLVRRRIQIKIDDIVQNAQKVTMVVPIDAHSDSSRMARVCGVNYISNFIPICDASHLALGTLVTKKYARVRRIFQNVRQPRDFLRWKNGDSVAFVLKIIAVGVVRESSVLISEEIGVENDKAKPIALEKVVSFLQSIRFEGFLWRTPIEIVIPGGVEARDVEIIVQIDEIGLFVRVVAKISAVDDEIALFALRTLLNHHEILRCSTIKRSGEMMNVGKNAEFHAMFFLVFCCGILAPCLR